MIAMMMVISFIGITELAKLNQDMDLLATDRNNKLALINEVAFRSMDNTRIARNIVLLNDGNARKSNKEDYDRNIDKINGINDQLDKAVKSEEGRKRLNAMFEAMVPFRNYSNEVIKFGLSNESAEAIKVLNGDGYKTQGTYFSAINALVEYQNQKVNETTRQAAENYQSARTLMLSWVIAALFIGTGLAFLITRQLLKQLGGEPKYAAERV